MASLVTPASAFAVPAPTVFEAAHPVTVAARLDEPLSRWLWLVKWLLATPHWILLAGLWVGFLAATLVALAAIVATGRYPRALFDFNVGVLRWTWRVTFYATAVLGTDRYPPFTLARTDFPAELEIERPERHSRGKALVKWWLLALPHYAVLAAFFGSWNFAWTLGGARVPLPGLLGVLVLVAGGILLVTGRYPRDVFVLVVGMSRWIIRVLVYAALMRDDYPPFRLDA